MVATWNWSRIFQARGQGGTLAPARTSHTLQRGEFSSRLEQTPRAALPQALFPGKAVQTSPHLPARGGEGISTAPWNLQEVIPEQKQLQLPLQDSSPEPSTQTASVQGRSTALFCRGHLGKKSNTFSQKEVVHRGRNSADGCLEAHP